MVIVVTFIFGLSGIILALESHEETIEINSNQVNSFDIYIDLSKSKLYLFENGNLFKQYYIAQGKPQTPTPVGIFKIVDKFIKNDSDFGARWMGLDVPW